MLNIFQPLMTTYINLALVRAYKITTDIIRISIAPRHSRLTEGINVSNVDIFNIGKKAIWSRILYYT